MRGAGVEMCPRKEYHGRGRARLRKGVAGGLGVLLGVASWAAPQDDPRFRIRTTVALVVVPVTVKDAAGQAVLDLRREEFRVLEDGVEQQLELFSNDPFPLSAVLLVDHDLPQNAAETVGRGLGAAAAGFSEQDEVAVARFDLLFERVADFTADNDALHEQLKRLALGGRFPGQGSAPMTAPPRVGAAPVEQKVPTPSMRSPRRGKNLDDAVFAAAQMLRGRSRERRKIILLVSDGANSRHNTYRYDDALQALLAADISVYAIGVGEALANRGRNPLARYARATGGDVFYAGSRAALEGLFRSVAEQARNSYTLAYLPRGTDPTRSYHSIEVRVRRPNLTLLARNGYFAPGAP